MHGRVSGSPARLSAYGVREADGGLEAFVEGAVTQVAVFGEHLTLTRRVSIAYGSAVIRVADEVANHGYASSPLAVMYHVNMGWPVVAPGARVKTPPRRLRGEGENSPVRAPSAGAPERVWVFAADPDAQGRGMAGIANSQVDAASAAGARLTWDAAALPTLVQWEMANVAGHYVIGLEPSTAFISAATDGAAVPDPGARSIEAARRHDRTAARRRGSRSAVRRGGAVKRPGRAPAVIARRSRSHPGSRRRSFAEFVAPLPPNAKQTDGGDAPKRHVQWPHHPPEFLRGHLATELCNEKAQYFKAPPVFHIS